MVQVAHSAPVFTVVVMTAELNTLASRLSSCLTAIIVGTDVGREKLIRITAISLGRKSEPSCCIMMIHNHVGNRSDSRSLECANHRSQFGLGSEARILVEIIIRCIAHRIVIL